MKKTTKNLKKALSLILSAAMVIGMFPMSTGARVLSSDEDIMTVDEVVTTEDDIIVADDLTDIDTKSTGEDVVIETDEADDVSVLPEDTPDDEIIEASDDVVISENEISDTREIHPDYTGSGANVAEVISGDDTTAYSDFNAAVEAWNNAGEGATLKLLENIETRSTINVTGANLKLDLNDHGIMYTGSGAEAASVITINYKKVLEINDSCTNDKTVRYITLKNHRGSEVSAEPGNDRIKIRGGYITGGNAEIGAGVYNAGTLTLNGGVICGNLAGSSGGGIYNAYLSEPGDPVNFTMNGGYIYKNHSKNEAGGIYNSGVFTLNEGRISGNTAIGSGGGIYNKKAFTMNGGEISENLHNVDLSVAVPNTFYNCEGGTVSFGTNEYVYTGIDESDISKKSVEMYVNKMFGPAYIKSVYVACVIKKTGETAYYTDFSTAVGKWKEAGDGATLKLLDNIDVNGIDIANISGQRILDLNDHGIFMQQGSYINTQQASIILTDNCGIETTRYITLTDGRGSAFDVSKPGSGKEGEDYLEVNGGYITGGSGCFVILIDAKFTMNGGVICGNKSSVNGGGFFFGAGTFVMNGGEIYGNSTDGFGGGIYSGSKVTMNGGRIYGNTAAKGGNAIYSPGRNVEFGGDVYVGVATGGSDAVKVDAATAINDINSYGYIEVKPGTAPVHNFTYTVKGATITAKCSDPECDLPGKTASITINAPEDLSYDGTAKEAKISGDTSVLGTPAIVYKQGTSKLASAPVNAGEYTASITLGDVTATVAFTINKVSISGAEITLGSSLSYNGIEQEQTVSKVELDGETISASEYTVTGNRGTRAGSYILTVVADENGNYTGSVSKEFTIAKKAIAPEVMVSGTYSYTGNKIIPEFTVTDGGADLDTAEYKVSICDNVNAGSGKITVTEAEKGNFTFEPVTRDFTIAKASWSGSTTAEVTKTYRYTDENSEVYDMTTLLPNDCGSVTYDPLVVSGTLTFKTIPAINDGQLSYTLSEGDKAASGTVTVTAHTQNYSNDFTLKINIKQQVVALFEKAGSTYEICTLKEVTQGKSFTLIPKFVEGEVLNRRVVWSSSNPDVATVTQDGKVTARSAGKTTITAMSEEVKDLTASCQVSVREPATAVSLSRKSYTFGTGESVILNATLLPFTASQELKWSTSDASAAVVCDGSGAELDGTASGKGKIYDVTDVHEVTIKATGTGKASITALAADGSGKKAVCKFTAGKPVPEFSVAGKGGKTSLVAGKTLAMTVNWGPKSSKPANTGITWSVEKAGGGDASAIATISSKGVLTGITVGTVRVTATSTSDPARNAYADIEVTKPAASKAPKVTGISISNKASLSGNGLYTGKSYKLKTKLTLSAKGKAASNAVAWISSDPAVATVSQKGVIKAVAPGSVTVRAVPRDTDNVETALGDSVTFNVYAKVKSVKTDKTKLTLGTQSDTQYGKISVVTISPADATNPSIRWTANSKSVSMAAIDKDGYPSYGEFKSADPVIINSGQALAVKGLKPGVVKLTGITMDGSKKKVKCTVTIRGEVTGLTLKTSNGKKGVNNVTLSDKSVPGKYTGNMKANSKMTLTPVVDINGVSGASTSKVDKKTYKAYKKYTDTSVSYRSSDTSVATVDKKGKISIKKGAAAGSTVTIFATTADGRYESSILITIVK